MRKVICIIIGFALLLSIAGCSIEKNEYRDFTHEYDELYFNLLSKINLHETLVIKQIHENSNSTKLAKLKNLLDGVKNKVPEGKKQHYNNLRDWYNDLIAISSTDEDWNKVPLDLRRKIFVNTVTMSVRLKEWKERSSDAAWE